MERNTIVSALFLLVIAYSASSYVYPSMHDTLSSWSDPVVTPSEVKTAEWIFDNLPHQSLFAGDLFGCEMLTATAFQVCSVGGAWELADNPNLRYQDNERSFLTSDASEAHSLMVKYGIQYVFVNGRQNFYAYGWKTPEIDKFNDQRCFKQVYSLNGTYVYQVLNTGPRAIIGGGQQ